MHCRKEIVEAQSQDYDSKSDSTAHFGNGGFLLLTDIRLAWNTDSLFRTACLVPFLAMQFQHATADFQNV